MASHLNGIHIWFFDKEANHATTLMFLVVSEAKSTKPGAELPK
jgi:hypothetical protein